MTILYFTATGNNLYLAKKIGGKLVSIPKAIKEGTFNFSDDKIGIIFPIYGLAVPQYIKEFLLKVHLDSNYIFAIMSYGMVAGGATGNLQTIAVKNGIHFSYINTIKMVDNSLENFEMGKQIAGESKKQIDLHLDSIIADISCNKQWVHKDSFIERMLTKQLSKSSRYKIGVGISNRVRIEDTCTKCGICSKVCPTDNIQVAENKPVLGTNCMNCLACTQNCPQNAIRLSNEKSRVRFRNQHIKLSEIVDSNK